MNKQVIEWSLVGIIITSIFFGIFGMLATALLYEGEVFSAYLLLEGGLIWYVFMIYIHFFNF